MKAWLFAFMICAVIILPAAEQGSPDVIRWEEEKKEVKVVETGRLEIFDRKPGKAGLFHHSGLQLYMNGAVHEWGCLP